jgi:hypothetical protein
MKDILTVEISDEKNMIKAILQAKFVSYYGVLLPCNFYGTLYIIRVNR